MESDDKNHIFEAKGKAGEDDVQALDNYLNPSATSSSSSGSVNIETESGPTALEKLNDKMKEFIEQKRDYYQKYVDKSLEVKTILEKMEEDYMHLFIIYI